MGLALCQHDEVYAGRSKMSGLEKLSLQGLHQIKLLVHRDMNIVVVVANQEYAIRIGNISVNLESVAVFMERT